MGVLTHAFQIAPPPAELETRAAEKPDGELPNRVWHLEASAGVSRHEEIWHLGRARSASDACGVSNCAPLRPLTLFSSFSEVAPTLAR